MNPSDDDLNRLLRTWTVPRSPDSLEPRVRRAYRDRARLRTMPGLVGVWAHWIAGIVPIAGKFTAVIASVVVLLAVITRAFPQSMGVIASPSAITLDSEFLKYEDDGSYTVTEYRTSSFSSIGGYTVLSSSFPGDPLRTAAGELLNPVKAILIPMMERMGRQRDMRALSRALAARIRNGCTPTNMWGRPMTVIGEETVLNYTTTVLQFRPEGRDVRFTEWFAPGLDCLSLKSTTETALADGAFRLASERRVLKMTRNSGGAAAQKPSR
jgi:hypothetical protein